VAACCLDARNVPGLPGIPPIEHDKVWAIVEELCVNVILDFMSTAAALLTTPFHLTSVEIARREIQV